MTQKSRTRKFIKKAHVDAAELGELKPKEPAELRVDGSPRIGPGQVYVMRTSTVFHPAWCSVVGDRWDSNPKGLLVIPVDGVGKRRQCKMCDDPLGD